MSAERGARLPFSRLTEDEATSVLSKPTDCWFDEPDPGDRPSWAMPRGHGTYAGLELEHLDPADEDDLTFLLEAMHAEFEAAFDTDSDVVADGQPVNPRMHVTLHQVVANQLLSDDPAGTWLAVQRLADLGYDWHNIMHMISALVSDDIYRSATERRRFDPDDYARRLEALPGDWPSPEELKLR